MIERLRSDRLLNARAFVFEHFVSSDPRRGGSAESARRLLYAPVMRDIRRKPNACLNGEVEVKEVPLSLIRESDALRLRIPPYFGVDDLADDIRIRGQTTPLFVRPSPDGHYELISGYCRRAALEQLKAASAIVRIFRDLDDEQAYDLAVSENQDRNALTELERGNVCIRLQKEGRTSRQIAERMGWTAESSVFRYLRIARDSPPPLRDALQNRLISLNIALTFLDDAMALPEETQREALAAAVEHEMSAVELKRYLRRAAGAEAPPAKRKDQLRVLKDGGFVLNAQRVESADAVGIARSIEILERALKHARRLRKNLPEQASTAVEEIQ